QDHGGTRTSDEARQVNYFQSRKNILSCHYVSLMYLASYDPPAAAGGTDRIASSALELSRAFLQKSLRTFLLVFCSGAEAEIRGLQRQAFSLTCFQSFVYRLE